MIIETIQQNIQLFLAVFAALGVPAFIYLITATVKDKIPMYTPYLALCMGMVFGFLVGVALFGFDLLTCIATIIHGAMSGASAVGLHQIGNKPKQEELLKEETIELPQDIKDILYEN